MMRKTIFIFGNILVLLFLILAFDASASSSPEYVVKVKEKIKQTNDIEKISYSKNLYTVSDKESLEEIDPENIEYKEKNHKFKLCTNDPYYEDQYNLTNINASYAWNNNINGQDMDSTVDMGNNNNSTDENIVIAVIDSGLYSAHEDIDYSKVIGGQDFISNNYLNDTLGHGTAIAGEILATRNNNKGIAGICSGIKLMPLKVFTSNETDLDVIVSALNYATSQKELYDNTNGKQGVNVCVINMSLSSDTNSKTLKNACAAAIDKGIIIVSAAGNEGDTTPSYPAQYTMGVGSINEYNKASSFSQILSSSNGTSYSKKVWVCAPGETICAPKTSVSGYGYKSGTSFAAPEVAALAALCKSLDNSMTQSSFMSLLKNTAIPIVSGNGKIDDQDVKCGYGRISFKNTLSELIDDNVPEHLHSPASPVKENNILPTCTSDGSYDLVTYCSDCGDELLRENITVNKYGHNYSSWINISSTQHRRTCSRNSSHVETENHTWDNGTVIKKATYSESGRKKYNCTKCNATKEVSISPLTHTHTSTYSKKENIKNATCTSAGGYDLVKYCSLCDKMLSKTHYTTKALGHDYGPWKKNNESYHYRVCSRNSNHIETERHTWNSGVVTKKATYINNGIKTYTCTKCKATKTATIPKLKKINISNAKMIFSPSVAVYDSNVKMIDLKQVICNGKTLILNTHYTFTPLFLTNAGLYSVQIKGIGEYYGTANANYLISKANYSFKNTSKKFSYKKNKIRRFSILKNHEHGKINYSVLKGNNKYIKVTSSGIVKIKKKAKGVFKIKINIEACKNYNSGEKIIKIKSQLPTT